MNVVRKFLQAIGFVPRNTGDSQPARAVAMQTVFDQVYNWLANSDQETGAYSWPLDLYLDSTQPGAAPGMFAIVARDGKLYRVSVKISSDGDVALGDWFELSLEEQGTGNRIVAQPGTPATLTEVDDLPPVVPQEAAAASAIEVPAAGATITISVVPRTSVTVQRQADGSYRWVARAATAVLNRVGEIDSRELFDSFVAHAQATGEYPLLEFFHQGEQYRLGVADWVGRDDAVYLAAGAFDDTPLARAAIQALQAEPAYWGTSIGYDPLDSPQLVECAGGVCIPVYRRGRNVEISLLPESLAAALFTGMSVQGVIRMNDKVREALAKLFADDEEGFTRFVASVDDVNRSILDRKLIVRAAGAAGDTGDTGADSGQPDAGQAAADGEGEGDGEGDAENLAAPELVLDEEAVDAIVARMAQGEVMQGLAASVATLADAIATLGASFDAAASQTTEALDALQGRLADLERTEAEKQRQWRSDLPAAGQVQVSYRPRDAHRKRAAGADDDTNARVSNTLAGLPAYRSANGS